MNTTRRSFSPLRHGLTAAAGTLVMVSSVFAQEQRVGLHVDAARPVDQAIYELTSRYPVVVTYEDPRRVYQGDMKDVTEATRKDLNAFPPGQAPRVLLPKGGMLDLEYLSKAGTSEPEDWMAALQTILNASQARGYGNFRVEQSNSAYHVIPTATRSETGQWVTFMPILDTFITIQRKQLDGFGMLEALCNAVSKATGEKVIIGSSPIDPLERYKGTLAASNEKARAVLLRILQSVDQRLTWRMYYGTNSKRYVINLQFVAPKPSPSRAAPSPPIDPGPSPAIRKFH